MTLLIVQKHQGTTAKNLARVPNQPARDQRVSVDRLAVPIDVVERLHLLYWSGWWVPQACCPLCEPIGEGIRSVRLSDLCEEAFGVEISIGPRSAREHAQPIPRVAAPIPGAIQSDRPEKEQGSHQHVTRPR
jgi:hypothetical protein